MFAIGFKLCLPCARIVVPTGMHHAHVACPHFAESWHNVLKHLGDYSVHKGVGKRSTRLYNDSEVLLTILKAHKDTQELSQTAIVACNLGKSSRDVQWSHGRQSQWQCCHGVSVFFFILVCAFAMGPRVEVQQEGPPPAARTTKTTQRMVANQQTTDGWTHASISETFQSERPRLPHHKNTNKNKIA